MIVGDCLEETNTEIKKSGREYSIKKETLEGDGRGKNSSGGQKIMVAGR